ncbi:hypothetical protein N0V90_012054 [Kalmusia sp. IMI 367209]|nr:hypothetical protein N0V90_012054 [Kalmusia sp. IMI 367209]
MAEVCDLYRQGVVQPIYRITRYDVSELQKAMTYMAKGEHIGKIVVTYQNPDTLVPLMPSSPRAAFDSEATYVLVGCVAGIGYFINKWMIERGAKHLVHLTRSGTVTPQAKHLLQSMVADDIDLVVRKCDVTVKQNVEAAIAEICSIRPIKGILHAAIVFEDVSFQDLQYPSAANSFQDAFARFRRAQGLPAQSFAMGMISDVGFASSRDDIHRSLSRNVIYGTPAPELIKFLDTAFTSPGATNSPFDPLADAHLLISLEPKRSTTSIRQM